MSYWVVGSVTNVLAIGANVLLPSATGRKHKIGRQHYLERDSTLLNEPNQLSMWRLRRVWVIKEKGESDEETGGCTNSLHLCRGLH